MTQSRKLIAMEEMAHPMKISIIHPLARVTMRLRVAQAQASGMYLERS